MSTNTFLFPDVNVWLALVHSIHPQHRAARIWAESLDSGSVVYFCRFTQLGLLRLLTNQSAMGEEVLTPVQAWEVFDSVMNDPGNRMMDEPRSTDALFRQLTNRRESSTKQWADGYLAAFAAAGGVRLVTFDRALAKISDGAVLLA